MYKTAPFKGPINNSNPFPGPINTKSTPLFRTINISNPFFRTICSKRQPLFWTNWERYPLFRTICAKTTSFQDHHYRTPPMNCVANFQHQCNPTADNRNKIKKSIAMVKCYKNPPRSKKYIAAAPSEVQINSPEASYAHLKLPHSATALPAVS